MSTEPKPGGSLGVAMKRKEDPRFIQGKGRYVDDISLPGMLLTAYAMLKHNPAPTDADIREGLAGNLCRCTGYQNIIKAVQQAAGTLGHASAATA